MPPELLSLEPNILWFSWSILLKQIPIPAVPLPHPSALNPSVGRCVRRTDGFLHPCVKK